MAVYQYSKTPIAIDRLTYEIRDSAITVALDSISALGADVTVVFKISISNDEKTILDNIVANHTGEAMPENESTNVTVVNSIETRPFAIPEYRTKLNATDAWVPVPPNTSETSDFKILAERHVFGGELLVKNAVEGDHICAEVMDLDGVIPVAYRSALCEDYPTVVKYIEKWWINPSSEYSKISIDTTPLIAKLTSGLYLRVTYHAVDSGVNRNIAINYRLTKKL